MISGGGWPCATGPAGDAAAIGVGVGALAEPGTDVAALAADRVSITPIYLNLTNIPVLAALRKVFE